jgi:hypothetical protein
MVGSSRKWTRTAMTFYSSEMVMLDASSEASAAVRLLLLAMTAGVTPAKNAEYGDLLQRYTSDAIFRDLAKAIAHGAELQICGESARHGLMLISHPGGFFAPTLDSFRRNMSFRERVAYGLLHFVLAAFVYPSEESLSEDEEGHMVRVSAPDVARFAVEVCEGLKTLAANGEVFSEQAVEGFSHLLSLRESDSTGGRQNVVSMLRFVLDKYADEGLLLRIEEQGDLVFRARPHFRVQVRFLVRETEARLFELMQQMRAGTDPAPEPS